MAWKQLIKNTLYRLGFDIYRSNTLIPTMAQKYGPEIVHYMASTGEGTNECMDKGCLPVLAHYYQPIPDLKDLEARKIWDKVSELRGVDWNPPRFIENLRELAVYSDECDWPNDPTENPMDFYLNNNCFSYGCAATLYSMIRKNKPKHIIEVGSGNSSRVIASALRVNMAEENMYKPQYIIIDPYSNLDVSLFPEGTELFKQRVETLDPSYFQLLNANDILFIDSSHVCKIGSDVNFEILEVLPSLNRDVYIHFHDISLPYEYPKIYATNPSFRMFWTESYLLQAFLSNNPNYEILLPMGYIQVRYGNEFRTMFPKGNNDYTETTRIKM
jgi:hypothetical protein